MLDRAVNPGWLGLVIALALSTPGSAASERPPIATDSSPSPVSASPSPTPVQPSPNINPARITLSVDAGSVGTALSVIGSGFPPNTTLVLYADQPKPYVASPARINIGGPQTDNTGAFRADFTMPSAGFGQHSICAGTGYPRDTAPNAVEACAQFAIQANITLSIYSGIAGIPFTIAGTGFHPSTLVDVYLDLPDQFAFPGPMASGEGAFNLDVQIPDQAIGQHHVCAGTGPPKNFAVVPVLVCALLKIEAGGPMIGLSVSSGPPGSVLIVKGIGFAPSTAFQLSIDGNNVFCAPNSSQYDVTDSQGTFLVKMAIELKAEGCLGPPLAIDAGRHSVCAHTGTKGPFKACAEFVVEGGSLPSAAHVLWPPEPLWVVVLLEAFLIALTVGAVLWVRRQSQRARRPPV